MRRKLFSTTAAALLVVLVPLTAQAAWNVGASGEGYGKSKTMPAGPAPTVSSIGRNVIVTWTASQLPGGTAVDDYKVRRYESGTGTVQTIGSSCSSFVSVLTCTEAAVPAGDWKYSVQPRKGNWLGAEGTKSTAVGVAGPSFTISSPTNLSSLPAVLDANIAGFITGESVQFRLDDATSGTLLTSTVTPSSIPNSGSATASLTIPLLTLNGAHTIYAVGDQGDVASANISISVLTPKTYTTAAYDLRDAASPPETNQTWWLAYADSKFTPFGTWGTTFSTSKYKEFDLSGPLQAGLSTSSMNLNYTFASGGANTTCVYFEIRRASTGALLGTHGSAGSPVACASNTTMVPTTTSIPEVTTTTLANDLRVRVYASNSASSSNSEDLVTVSGSSSNGNFTLYPVNLTDNTGASPFTFWWGLQAAGDSSTYTSAAPGWGATFTSTQYLKFSFPGYTPSGAQVTGATFNHRYASNTTGTTCYYVEVYNGASLIGTHGSITPYCNATSTLTTDYISLPEVDTVAEANNVTIKMYVRSSTSKRSIHDLASLKVDYSS